MPKKTNPNENFFFGILKTVIPQILGYIVGAIIAFIILRTDVTSLTRRVTALESSTINRDLVTVQFENLDKRLISIEKQLESFGLKLDRHLEK